MTPRRIVLDTSAYSRFRSGDDRVASFIAAADSVLVPVVVVAELDAGFLLGGRAADNQRVLAEFLAEPFVTVATVTVDVANHWSRLFAALRAAGTPHRPRGPSTCS